MGVSNGLGAPSVIASHRMSGLDDCGKLQFQLRVTPGSRMPDMWLWMVECLLGCLGLCLDGLLLWLRRCELRPGAWVAEVGLPQGLSSAGLPAWLAQPEAYTEGGGGRERTEDLSTN